MLNGLRQPNLATETGSNLRTRPPQQVAILEALTDSDICGGA